jgi:multidrug efflux pump
VRAELAKLNEALPPGTTVEVMYDESQFIRASINGVIKVLLEGIALVVLVILVFLRDWRSTIVAIVAIPVSVLASYMVVAFFGASINVLTLLAVVLAIGIVVDDAIVEIENVHRRIEEGQAPLLASFDGRPRDRLRGDRHDRHPDGGVRAARLHDRQHGRLFREFAIQLAGRDLLLRRGRPHADPDDVLEADGAGPWPHPALDRAGLRRHEQRLSLALTRALRIPLVFLAAGVVVSLSAYSLFMAIPKEFAPTEDRGVIIIPVRSPKGQPRLHPRAGEGGRARHQAAGGQGVVSSLLSQVAPGSSGPAPVNEGIVIVRLVPVGPAHREAAGRHAPALRQRDEFPRRARLPEQPALARPARLRPAADPVRDRRPRLSHDQDLGRPHHPARPADGLFANIDTDYKESQPDVRVQIDRARAADLGVAGRGYRAHPRADLRRARGLDLRQPRRRVPGDHAGPRAGPGDALRPRQYLHPLPERRTRPALGLRHPQRGGGARRC